MLQLYCTLVQSEIMRGATYQTYRKKIFTELESRPARAIGGACYRDSLV